MTFRQQLLSSLNCCLLFSARGRHREQQIVVDVAQLVGPQQLEEDSSCCRNVTENLVLLTVVKDVVMCEDLSICIFTCLMIQQVIDFSS